MKGRIAFIFVLAVLAAFALIIPSGAWAYLYVVDFVGSGSGNAGSISYAGGATPLVATNIQVDRVYGKVIDAGGTVVYTSSEYSVSGSDLDFTTGNRISGWTFGPGGSITLTGTVNGSITGALLSGSMVANESGVSAEVIRLFQQLSLCLATFQDTKNQGLLNLLFGSSGYATPGSTGWNGGLHFDFYTSTLPLIGSAFESSSVGSIDVANTVVPVPPSVWLFGAGLVGLVGLRRKLRK
jgi:hypothetical protein